MSRATAPITNIDIESRFHSLYTGFLLSAIIDIIASRLHFYAAQELIFSQVKIT